MPQIVYVNGQYVPRALASISIEDRGCQFSDGVYQVLTLFRGTLIDEEAHLETLDAYLKSIDIPPPLSRRVLKLILRRLRDINRLEEAHVYIQVTRGVQKRAHIFEKDLKPSLVIVMTPCSLPALKEKVPEIKVITGPDQRWGRPDIKSLGLLPNILAKAEASRQGAYECWQIQKGVVTEGCSSNAWIVSQEGFLQTHPSNGAILNGVTRQTILKLAQQNQFKILEKPFTLEEAQKALEAFITASFSLVRAVVSIDGVPVGTGKAGPVTCRLAQIYGDYMEKEAHTLRP